MARRKLRNLDNRILKKVVAHGAKYGIDEISTKVIAEEIGITEPTIYVHFHTRSNLLLVANEYAVKELASAYAENDATILSRWELCLKAASENAEAAKYAYLYRQKNLSDEFDHMFSKIVDVTDPIKASVLEHFLFSAACGLLEVNEENVKKTFDIISSL